MSARCILAGRLMGAVERRQRDDGTPFAFCVVRTSDASGEKFWKVFAKDGGLIARLALLVDGEPVAVAGTFSASLDPGRSQLTWRLVADAIIDVRHPKPNKRRAPR